MRVLRRERSPAPAPQHQFEAPSSPAGPAPSPDADHPRPTQAASPPSPPVASSQEQRDVGPPAPLSASARPSAAPMTLSRKPGTASDRHGGSVADTLPSGASRIETPPPAGADAPDAAASAPRFRPTLRLERASAPRVARTARQRSSRTPPLAHDIASASGGTVQPAPQGRLAVDLPPPPGAAAGAAPAAESGPTVARAVNIRPVGDGLRAREAGAQKSRQNAPQNEVGEQSGPDIEEIYDKVVSRLRRELRGERERVGDVLGNLRPGRSGR